MKFSKYNAHIKPLFKNLNLFKISNIYKLEVRNYMHRFLSNQNLTQFNNYKQTSKLLIYETRLSSPNNYFIHRAQTEQERNKCKLKCRIYGFKY